MGVDLSSLFSGLAGSIIGVVGTVWATNATIKNTSKEAERLENKREKKQKILAFQKLNIELFEIKRILGRYDSKVFLPSSAWEATKPFITSLSYEQFEFLFDVYDMVHEYNVELKIETGKEVRESLSTISSARHLVGSSSYIGSNLMPIVEEALKELQKLNLE